MHTWQVNDPSRSWYPAAAFSNAQEAGAADAARMAIAEWLRERELETPEGGDKGRIVWWETPLAQGRREQEEMQSWMAQALADQRLRKAVMRQDAQLEMSLLRLGGEVRAPVALDAFRADLDVAKACSAGPGPRDPLVAVPLDQVPAGMRSACVQYAADLLSC